MSLDEISNDITKKTPACFEPSIDYVVVKIPKWQFEKFPGADTTLGTQMKSVGEVMAIGRTFKEALQKGIRSLEPSSPVARAGGNSGIVAARKTGDAAAGSHSLAADRSGSRTACQRNH